MSNAEESGDDEDESIGSDSDWTSGEEDESSDLEGSQESEAGGPEELLSEAANLTPKYLIDVGAMPTDVRFSDTSDIFATADMDGRVKVWNLSTDNHPTLQFNLEAHRSPCRAVRFMKSGNLLSVGKDKRLCIVDVQEGKISATFKKVHASSVYCVLPLGDYGAVTGDDAGCVKAWDIRDPEPVAEYHDNNEFISAFATDERENVLLATSGDGTLSAFDIRRQKLKLQSEAFPAELLSLCVIKNGSKVVCGSGDGSLLIFKWGEWGYTLDQYPSASEMSIDSIEMFSSDRVITANSDGHLRFLNMMPYQMLAYCGYHTMPFERLSLSMGKTLLASTSHDSILRVWDVSKLDDIPGIEVQLSDSDEEDSKPNAGQKRKNRSTKMPKRGKSNSNFFGDL